MELVRVQDSDYRKTYELYMSFPENENGYMNNVYGYSYEKFLEWIEKKRNWSLGKELPDGFVPDTTYVLVVEDAYVGVFNLRHCLNDFLREGPGHIGYCISQKYRGKGYATKGLELTLIKARQMCIHEVYMSVNKDNPASLRVQIKNGAYIHHENEKEYFTRINMVEEGASRGCYKTGYVMKTREEVLKYGISFPNTYQEAPFHDQNWQLVRYNGNRKAFLWTYERDGYVNLNVKVDPEKAHFWRKIYKSVIPGYHQNKEHWNTIILDGSIPDKDIKLMIAESYDLISDSPSKRIYEAVKKIPYGHVATYAQIAELAGDKKMARAVGNALHKNPDPDNIPCFRVVNSKGELAGEFAFGGLGAQARLLEAEGITVTDGRVDLGAFQWKNY